MKQNFYRAFEDRFRGSREEIRGRQKSYAPFIKPLVPAPVPAAPRPRALDLGCGRGEWLELLGEWGFDALGVDMDAGMLAACREAGLDVIEGDALAYLRTLPDASQAVVSAFHVVEHISFADLETLVAESLRVLEPAGLLILETPNPESLIVGTERFYLDPTHTQPIPHLLLSFMLEYSGFARVKVLPLQEPPGIRDKADVGLFDVLAGTSPDYAAIGQKAASAEVLQLLDGVFAASHGQDLLSLALRFDNRHAATTTTHAQQLLALQQALDERMNQWGHESQNLRQAIFDLRQTSTHLQQAHTNLQQAYMNLQQTVEAVYSSTSWRMTAPVRMLGSLYRGLRRRVRPGVPAPLDTSAPQASGVPPDTGAPQAASVPPATSVPLDTAVPVVDPTKAPAGPTAREAHRLLESEKTARQQKP